MILLCSGTGWVRHAYGRTGTVAAPTEPIVRDCHDGGRPDRGKVWPFAPCPYRTGLTGQANLHLQRFPSAFPRTEAVGARAVRHGLGTGNALCPAFRGKGAIDAAQIPALMCRAAGMVMRDGLGPAAVAFLELQEKARRETHIPVAVEAFGQGGKGRGVPFQIDLHAADIDGIHAGLPFAADDPDRLLDIAGKIGRPGRVDGERPGLKKTARFNAARYNTAGLDARDRPQKFRRNLMGLCDAVDGIQTGTGRIASRPRRAGSRGKHGESGRCQGQCGINGHKAIRHPGLPCEAHSRAPMDTFG